MPHRREGYQVADAAVDPVFISAGRVAASVSLLPNCVKDPFVSDEVAVQSPATRGAR